MADDFDEDPFLDKGELDSVSEARIELPEIHNPLQPLSGNLNLTGDMDKALTQKLEAGKLTGQLNSDSGINQAIAEDGEYTGMAFRSRMLEDGTVVKVQHLGLPLTQIEHPVSVEDNAPEERTPVVEEGVRSFQPFLWVGAKYMGGGTIKFPAWHSPATKGRQNALHMAVWEPADSDHNDGANGESHNIVSNREIFMVGRSNWDRRIASLHGKYPVGVQNSSNDVYPDGPVNSQNLEFWHNPLFLGTHDDFNGGGPKPIPVGDEALEEYEVIIRSTRITDNIDVLSDTGVGSVHARSGDYYIKLQLAHWFYGDWMNLHPVTYEVRVVVGRATGEVLIRTFVVEMHESTGYLMGILPHGWYPQLNNFPASGYEGCNSCATAIPDMGSNSHGGSWWQSGIRVTMPDPQLDEPGSRFAAPEVWVPRGHKLVVPPTGFTTKDTPRGTMFGSWLPKIQNGVWPARIDRSGDCVTAGVTYTRITINAIIGLLAWSTPQVALKSEEFQPEGGCGSVPETIIIQNDKIRAKTFYAGTYTGVKGGSKLIVPVGESPGGGIAYWDPESCFGAIPDVIIPIVFPISQGVQDLVDAELNPIQTPFIMYLKTTFGSTASTGSDYGDGQAPTIINGFSDTSPSSKEEWDSAGGPGGYFSGQFTIKECSRVLNSF
jgi:hypothetical protein